MVGRRRGSHGGGGGVWMEGQRFVDAGGGVVCLVAGVVARCGGGESAMLSAKGLEFEGKIWM